MFVAPVEHTHIPLVATTASHDNILSGIAVNQTRLIPDGRQLSEELLHLLGLCKEALWTVGQMLQCRLKDYGQRQLMAMSGDVRMLRVAKGTRRVVHRSDDISCEGQHAVMRRSLAGERRHVVIPFGTIDALRGEKVRPRALPAARNRSAMEVHQQMMARAALQQVLTVLHVHLVIAGEEVDLHTCHPDALTPSELSLAVFRFVQSELRSRCTIDPSHRRVIPYHRLHALLAGIRHCVFNGLAILHLVPFGIDEHIGQMQRHRHVDILLNDVVIVGAVIVSPVDPRHHAGLNPTGIGNFTRLGHVGDERRLNDISQRTHNDYTPRRMPRPADFNFILIRNDTIEFAFAMETRCTLSRLNVRLADEGIHRLSMPMV